METHGKCNGNNIGILKRKAVSQEKSRITAFLCPIRSQCCTNYNAPTGALDSKASKALLENFKQLVRERDTTILMVTHDVFSASYCDRILFIRDGKLFQQLVRGTETRKDFFNQIVGVISLLGGDLNENF